MSKGARAVFLDRDGVLNELVHRSEGPAWDSPYTLEEFRLLPGAAGAVGRLNRMGFLVVVVSNQPGVAKGRCTPGLLDRLDRKLFLELATVDARLDGIYYCLHHPEGTVPQFSGPCECRKPKPGLLVDAARKHGIDLASSYMVGDRDVDMAAGASAGCRTILVSGSPASPPPPLAGSMDLVARDLEAAVQEIGREEMANGNLPGHGRPEGDRSVARVRRPGRGHDEPEHYA